MIFPGDIFVVIYFTKKKVFCQRKNRHRKEEYGNIEIIAAWRFFNP